MDKIIDIIGLTFGMLAGCGAIIAVFIVSQYV